MVYVDDYEGRFGRMVMCHMFADSLEELHEFAARLGLRRSWFQGHKAAHYDVCKAKRALALELGAVELPIRNRVEWQRVHLNAVRLVNPKRADRLEELRRQWGEV